MNNTHSLSLVFIESVLPLPTLRDSDKELFFSRKSPSLQLCVFSFCVLADLFISLSLSGIVTQSKKNAGEIFYLFLIDAPEAEFFLKQRPTDVWRAVKFSCAVKVQDLRKNPWVSVEEVLLFRSIVFGCPGHCSMMFSKIRESSIGNGFQRT